MTPWNQKHILRHWLGHSNKYRSITMYSTMNGYEKRGRGNRELYIVGVKMRLIDGTQLVTKRYSRWNTVG